MTYKNVTDRYTQEILEKLDALIESSVELSVGIECCEDYKDILLYLDEVIDEFCESAELVGEIRAYLMELHRMNEKDKAALQDDMNRIAEQVKLYERLTAQKRRQGKLEPELSIEESVAMLFYDTKHHRIFPFIHVMRICPWLDERSVMYPIPGLKDLYYLYEEGAEVQTEKGEYLVGPVVVIKLDGDDCVVAPSHLDQYLVRQFMEMNTEDVTFEEGAVYEAFRLV